MTGAEFLEVILPQWRASLPSSVPRSYFDRFVARKRAELEAKFGALLEHLSRAKARPTTPPAQDIDAPADQRVKSQRMKANLAAVQLVVQKRPGEFTAAELQVLLGYSGHGGLSIEQVRDQFPPELQPETFGLIHEYYTPTVLADAIGDMVCALLPALIGRDGYIRAL